MGYTIYLLAVSFAWKLKSLEFLCAKYYFLLFLYSARLVLTKITD